MKKRARVLLLFGGILMAVGFVICIVGAVASNISDDQLFAAKTTDGKGYTYQFSGDEINKIDINVINATVNIYGGADTSYIELVNFNENLYSFSSSNRLITFHESPDVSSLLRFWESGFTFKGMRYVLRIPMNKGEKTINIYLTDNDYVKNFTLNAKKGKFNITNLKTSTDYELTLDNGAVSMDNISTESLISINSPSSTDCDFFFNKVTAKNMVLKAAQADVKATALALGTGDINITHGSITLDYAPTAKYYNAQINTTGKLTVNGKPFIDAYTIDFAGAVAEGENSEGVAASALKIEGRELAVYIEGECFNNSAATVSSPKTKNN